MSYSVFSFYYWLVFIWGGAGMLIIAVAVIREMVLQWRQLKGEKQQTQESMIGGDQSW